MSTPTSDRLRGAVEKASHQSGQVAERQQPPSIYQLIDRQRAEIAKALPKHMNADRLARVVSTVIRANPKLLECTPMSLLGALMLSAQTGLEPGPLGHCYWVPFWNRNVEWTDPETGRSRKGANEVTWIMGYTGIIDLANRSGQMASPVFARPVYKGDDFEYDYGLNENLIHHPKPDADRSEENLVAVYGVARFKDGGRYFEVMHRPEIDKRRARSKASDRGPWVSDYERMAMKSVVRSMRPFLPLSIEAQNAMIADERTHQGVVQLEDVANAIPAERENELPTSEQEREQITAGPNSPAPPDDEPEHDPETGAVIDREPIKDATVGPVDPGELADMAPTGPAVEEPPAMEGWPETPAPGSKGSGK